MSLRSPESCRPSPSRTRGSPPPRCSRRGRSCPCHGLTPCIRAWRRSRGVCAEPLSGRCMSVSPSRQPLRASPCMPCTQPDSLCPVPCRGAMRDTPVCLWDGFSAGRDAPASQPGRPSCTPPPRGIASVCSARGTPRCAAWLCMRRISRAPLTASVWCRCRTHGSAPCASSDTAGCAWCRGRSPPTSRISRSRSFRP